MTATDRAADMRDARDDHAREVAAGLVDYEVPAEVLDRHPGFRPLDPATWPDPDRCVEGRPWGVDAFGNLWSSPADRWRAWLTAGRSARPCRNRWRDEATRLCGTHLNAYQRTLATAERRVRRTRHHEQATDLARQLARHEVVAEAASGGVLLRLDDARALVTLLDLAAAYGLVEAARRHLDRTTHATPTREDTAP